MDHIAVKRLVPIIALLVASPAFADDPPAEPPKEQVPVPEPPKAEPKDEP